MEIPIDEEMAAHLALNRVSGVGSVIYSNLLEAFSSASAVFSANRQQLSRVAELTPELVDKLLKGIDATGVETDIQWLHEASSNHAIYHAHTDYPVLLINKFIT